MTLICMKDNQIKCTKAMKVLSTYLKNDSAIFNGFQVNKPLIRKLKF